MFLRVLGIIVVIFTICVAAVFFWPQGFGLQEQWVIAHVVALRGVCAAVGLILFALCTAIAIIRNHRRLTSAALAVVFLLFAGGNIAVIAARGLTSYPLAEHSNKTTAESGTEQITILAWNTKGEEPGLDAITDLAVSTRADIIVLPETTGELGEQLAVRMRQEGNPMWEHDLAYDDTYKARSTTVLISARLGSYQVVNQPVSGPPLNTNTLPTVVAVPVNGKGPTIVAAHAVSPRQGEVRNWRSDLNWLQQQCQSENVIMAGDFNATVDHFANHGNAGGDLGRCKDSADQAHAAGIGTWPTWLPPILGTPIDHVLATPNWRVEGFEVVQNLDDSGSLHRPVVARLSLIA